MFVRVLSASSAFATLGLNRAGPLHPISNDQYRTSRAAAAATCSNGAARILAIAVMPCETVGANDCAAAEIDRANDSHIDHATAGSTRLCMVIAIARAATAACSCWVQQIAIHNSS